MKLITMAVMKRMVQSITVILALIIFSSVSAFGQQQTQAEKEKQKEAELKQKQAEELLKKEQQAATQEQLVRTYEQKAQEYDRQARDFEEIRKRAEVMSKRAVVMIPDEGTWTVGTSPLQDLYFYNTSNFDSPGSSWNYSRQVVEATFSNEFTMSAGDEGNVNLSISGTCAEGAISVAILMPDGKQLSEVIIDENGSLNWRKSFEADESNNWKNGKWIFRIKSKNATGNFRISMTSN
jgi:hypothetical protein